jgi:hypothetical protein
MKSNQGCFTPGQVLLASAIGGMPAGLFLYRHNARRFGKSKEGNQVFSLGIVLTILGIGIAFMADGPLTERITRAFGPVSIILPFILTRQTQKDDLKRYQEGGGSRASYGSSALVGLVSLLVILSIASLGVILKSSSAYSGALSGWHV